MTRTVSGRATTAAQAITRQYIATGRNGQQGFSRTVSITVFDLSFVPRDKPRDFVNSFFDEDYSRGWLLLEPADIQVRDVLARTRSYRFRLGISRNAGFVVDGHRCDFRNVPSSSDLTMQWTTWRSIDDDFAVARCYFGKESSSTVKVQIRTRNENNVLTTYDLFEMNRSIGHTWHQDDTRIKYYFLGTGEDELDLIPEDFRDNAFSLLDPNPEPFGGERRVPSSILRDTTMYQRGADVWHDSSLGISIVRTENPAEADVILAGYWNDEQGLGKEDARCGYSIACIYVRDGAYPHISKGRTMWFEERPQFTTSLGNFPNTTPWKKAWTNSHWVHILYPHYYHYLPGTIAHEFGHLLGIGHARSGSGFMRSNALTHIRREVPPCGLFSTVCGLGSADEFAIEEIYGER